MKSINIWIPGEPSRVTHQSGTRHLRSGRSYKTKALKDWEATLKAALLPYRLQEPMDGLRRRTGQGLSDLCGRKKQEREK